MRTGFFIASFLISGATAVSIYYYLKAPVTRSITGYVISAGDGDTGSPVANAKVELRLESDPEKLISVTQSGNLGWFTFPELASQEYRIRVKAPGTEEEIVRKVQPGTNITIRPKPAANASKK